MREAGVAHIIRGGRISLGVGLVVVAPRTDAASVPRRRALLRRVVARVEQRIGQHLAQRALTPTRRPDERHQPPRLQRLGELMQLAEEAAARLQGTRLQRGRRRPLKVTRGEGDALGRSAASQRSLHVR